MARDLPLHVQVLRHLKKQAEARKRKLEYLVGRGMEDREYQRHVGRIAECAVQIEEINGALKMDPDRLEEAE